MILRFRHKGHAHSTESLIRRYKIEGLRCNRCKENAEKVIAAIDGVESVTIDLASGTTEIKGSFDEDLLNIAVEALGFKTGRIS